jgi:hypothetical protein
MKLIKKKKKKKTKGIQLKEKKMEDGIFFFKENLFALLLNQTRHVNLENS